MRAARRVTGVEGWRWAVHNAHGPCRGHSLPGWAQAPKILGRLLKFNGNHFLREPARSTSPRDIWEGSHVMPPLAPP
jgi:hypothetical protein